MSGRKKIMSLILLSLVLLLSSCSDDQGTGDVPKALPVQGTDAGIHYISSKIVLPESAIVLKAFTLDGNFGFVYTGKDHVDRMVIADPDGELISSAELGTDGISDCCAVDGQNVVVTNTSGRYSIYDTGGRLITSSEPLEYPEPDVQVVSIDDGFIMSTSHGAGKYSHDGVMISEITYDEAMYPFSLFVQNGTPYVMATCETGDMVYDNTFYRLDFGNGTTGMTGQREAMADIPGVIFKTPEDPVFAKDNNELEYVSLDVSTGQLLPVVKVSQIMMCPPSYSGYTPGESGSSIVRIDDTHYYWDLYYYNGDCTEIILITLDDEHKVEGREQLTIRTDSAVSDPVLMKAVYEFNTMQDDYWAEIIPADSDIISAIEDPELSSETLLGLYREFLNGNAPDIWCGNTFASLNEDMFLPIGADLSASGITPSIYDIMTPDGEMRHIFIGYALTGMWGTGSGTGNGSFSFDDMRSKGNALEIFGNVHADELAYYLLAPHLNDLDQDQILDVVSFVSGGFSPEETGIYHKPDIYDLGTGDTLLCLNTVSSAAEYVSAVSACHGDGPGYKGYPAVNGQVFPVIPYGFMGISSSTGKADACAEFISILLSEDCQKLVCANGHIPVSDKVFRECMNIMQHPESLSDDELLFYNGMLLMDNGNKEEISPVPMSPSDAGSFEEQVMLADMVVNDDPGLRRIISEEITSLFTQGKSPEEVAVSLKSRLDIYINERG